MSPRMSSAMMRFALTSLRYRTARLFARMGGLTRGLGCSGGAVMTELFFDG